MVSLVIEPRKAHGKSRVTNRPNELLVEPVDKRSAAVRRFKDVLAAIVSDLEGANRLSAGQKRLCRRSLDGTAQVQQGWPVTDDPDAYGSLAACSRKSLR